MKFRICFFRFIPFSFILSLLCLFAGLSAVAQSVGDSAAKSILYFPITEIPETNAKEVTAIVAAGNVHGLFGKGEDDLEVLSVSSEEYPDRAGMVIGRGRVTKVKDSTCVVRITPADPESGRADILVGDLVGLRLRPHFKVLPSLLFDLIGLNIYFADGEERPFYTYFDFGAADHSAGEYEGVVLAEMLNAIHATAERLRTIPEPDSSLTDLMPGGRFRGAGIIDAMERSTPDDLRSFLRFVRAYPARYMGHLSDLNVSYAAWILNSTPIAQEDLREQLLEAGNDEDVAELLTTYEEDIASGQFLYDWISTAEGWALQGDLEQAKKLNRIVEKGARLQSDQNAFAWSLFVGGRIAEGEQAYAKAADLYREASGQFGEVGSTTGLAAAMNNLGSVLHTLSRYEEALGVYDTALVLKEERYMEDGTSESLESLGHTVAGRGSVLTALGRYREGLEAYDRAYLLYDSAGTANSPANTAWGLMRAAAVLNKTGEYEQALSRLNTALEIYRKIKDRNGEADVLDEIAYQYSGMDRKQEALRNYEAAYEIHLAMNDKQDAGFSKSNAGQIYWGLGDYREAEKSHRLAILLREEAEDLPGQAYSWHKLGEMFRESGDPNAALDAYQHATDIYRTLEDRAGLADVLSSAGDVYYGQKSWRAALERYEGALAVRRQIGAQDGIATTLYNIGNVYFSDHKYQKARDAFQESLRIRTEIGDKSNAVYNLTGLGLVAWEQHDYDGAKSRFNAALALAEEVNSISDVAWCRLVIARVEGQKGEYRSALENYEEALKLYREVGEKSGEIDALLGIGDMRIQEGKFDEGLKRFRQAQEIAGATNNRSGMGSALTSISGVHILLGEYDLAVEAGRQSLAINQEVNNLWGVASAFTGLGNTCNAIGEYRQAIDYYRLADSVYRELGDTLARATPMNNTGTVYFFQGDNERALSQFNQVLHILRSAGQEDEFLAIVISNIGEVYYQQGRYADAEQWLRQALELEESVGARRMIASTSTILTKTMMKSDRLEEAEQIGKQALALTQEIGEQEQLVEINSVMGELAMRSSGTDMSRAEGYLTAAVDISSRIGSTKYLWSPLYSLGIIYRDRGDRHGAIAHLERSVETIEKLRDKVAGGEAAQKLFASDRAKVVVYEALIALLIEEGEIEKALGYLERSSSEDLRSRFRSLEPSFADPEKRELLEKGREMKARIDKLAGQIASEQGTEGVTGDKIERLQEIVSIAEKDYIRFVNETIREQPDLRNYFSAGVNPIELRQRKQKIPRDVAVVSYLIGERQLFAFVATSDTVVARVVPIRSEDVRWKIRRFYQAVEEPGKEEDASALSAELYDLLIAPVGDRIVGYDKLAIIAGGDLSYLPFGALRSGEGSKEYLMQGHTVFYISDLGVFLEDVGKEDPLRLIAFGNADGTLPNAEKEVQDIAALYPGSQVYLRGQATEERAKNVPQGYNALHFATHGTLDYSHFEDSWLTLAATPSGGDDGRLTLEEVWGITNLAGCRMVTLSACNTAVSNEVVEGWPVNPANAFLQVGVPRVIATLWQVDDEATAMLMREFYRNLRDHGSADALRLAQQKLAADPKYASPYYWGPFVLLGDWR